MDNQNQWTAPYYGVQHLTEKNRTWATVANYTAFTECFVHNWNASQPLAKETFFGSDHLHRARQWCEITAKSFGWFTN